MKRAALAVLTVTTLAAADSALALPAFARRYGLQCHFCHDGYPKLTHVGQRFKERGFRMEQEGDFDAEKWIRSLPLAARAHVNRFFIEDFEGSTTGFLKGVSAGNLGRRVSYWVDDAFLITEGDDSFRHLKPANAWGRFELIQAEKLYLKAGRLELDLPFTQARTPHLFSYDIYNTNTGVETDTIGSYQEGLEVGGALPGDVRWSAAVVKGRNSETAERFSDDAGDFDGNLFLRLSKRFDRHRGGGFAYIGRNTLAPAAGVEFRNDILRLGLDADIWVRRLNLYGVFIHARNSNSIPDTRARRGTNEPLTFDGGFAQADWHVHDRVVLSGRLNLVNRPSDENYRRKTTYSSFFPGIQVFLFERGKLSFEYGLHNRQRRNFGAVQAEVAF
jgi:hypothetical protein